jgi:hypothetical protein
MIDMVVLIIAPRVVPYPTVILRVNVRRVRMPLLVPVSPPLVSRLRLRRLSAPILIATPLLTSIIGLLPLLLWRRIPHRLRPVLRYVSLANSLVAPTALLLLFLLFLLISLLSLLTFLLLLTRLLLPAFFLRKDSLNKRRHSKHHHHRKKSPENSRKPFHTPPPVANPNEISGR